MSELVLHEVFSGEGVSDLLIGNQNQEIAKEQCRENGVKCNLMAGQGRLINHKRSHYRRIRTKQEYASMKRQIIKKAG